MFSQTTEYAMRAMAWLALTPGTLVSTLTLAEKTKVPPHYLAKVLQQLSAAQLIVGRRGVRGGYKLSRPPSQITVLDVVRSVAEIQRITACPLGIASHGTTLCSLHRLTDAAAKGLIELYGGTTLYDLVSDEKSLAPLCETGAPTKLTISVPTTSRS
jgi:Rrf2 family transcriptional regulator, nitric oxide-sensitive transcriptional repressor